MPGTKVVSGFLLLLALLLAAAATAQSGDPCYSDPALSICGLDNATLDYTYDPQTPAGPPPLDFTSHSCKWHWKKGCQKALPYNVRVDGYNNSNNFLLTGPGGASLAVDLSYTDGTGTNTTLPASGGLVGVNGTVNSQATSITAVLVTDPQTLTPGTYSETFTLTASQSGGCGSDCGYLGGIDFTVSVTIPPRITVTNFDDMDLSGSVIAGQPIERSEDFCVGGIGFDRYSVALSSGNGSTGGAGSSPFQLNGNFDSLPYTVAFIDNTGSNSGITADNSGQVGGTFPRTAGMNCAGDNARIFVTVATNDWENAEENSYTDTLTITVTTQ